MIMQLVIMSPTNTDSCLLISKAYAFKNWSTTMTSEAMTVICTIMRMLVGTCFRIRLTPMLEKASTKITARHITIAVSSLLVTASAEQIPSICRAIGLLLRIGSSRVSLFSAMFLRFQLFEIRSETAIAQPVSQHVGYPPSGNGRSRQAIDLIF